MVHSCEGEIKSWWEGAFGLSRSQDDTNLSPLTLLKCRGGINSTLSSSFSSSSSSSTSPPPGSSELLPKALQWLCRLPEGKKKVGCQEGGFVHLKILRGGRGVEVEEDEEEKEVAWVAKVKLLVLNWLRVFRTVRLSSIPPPPRWEIRLLEEAAESCKDTLNSKPTHWLLLLNYLK